MKDTNLFPDVVGQESAKRQLQFYLKGYHASRILPTLFFSGCPGAGKSMLALETAKHLFLYDENGQVVMKEDGKTPKKKSWLPLNAASIKNVRDFISRVFVPNIVDKDVSVFLDEVHALKEDVSDFLLTILNPNASNKNHFSIDDYEVEVDFKKQSFLLASSEPHLVKAALLNRMTPISLADYDYGDLAKILQKSIPDITFDNGLLEEIPTVLRSSARCAVNMAHNVKIQLGNKKHLTMKDWYNLKESLSILPYGINAIELSLLKILQANPSGSSLTNLAAKTSLSRDAIMREHESYLQRLGFMRIEAGRGRIISAAGQKFLMDLK